MPDLYDSITLAGAIGPGFPNRPEDLARIGPIIEERSGASPFASLPDDGTTDAGGLTPGFRGSLQAFQIATGNDPDGIVLPDGPTLEAMNRRGGGFAPFPKIKATVGSRGLNRPEDLANAQSTLARVGYAPRPVDPSAPGYRRIDKAAVTRGLRAYQRDNGFKVDGYMDPGKETETGLHEQIGRQQKALEGAWTDVTKSIIRAARAGDPAAMGVSDFAGARALAGRAIGNSVTNQQAEQLGVIRKEDIILKSNADRPRQSGEATIVPAQYKIDRDTPQIQPPSVRSQPPAPADRPKRSEVPSQQPRPADRTSDTPYPYIPINRRSDSPNWRNAPVLTKWQKRQASILRDTPAIIVVHDNPNADPTEPWYSFRFIGSDAVRRHSETIEKEAKRLGVDPDLVRAIMYVENAQGHYFGYAKEAEQYGLAGSIYPMNIQWSRWGDLLGYSKRDFYDPVKNIRAGVLLIKRIHDRIDHPTIAKIATSYNSLAKDRVSDYGARVAYVYKHKPWRRR